MTIDEIMARINNGREYRNIQPMEIREADSNENNMVVEGYATTYGNEYLLYDWGNYRVYESVAADAFADCDMSDVIMQYNHEGRVFAANRNNTLSVSSDAHGLRISARLGGTELGRQVYEEIKGGYSTQMSMGFRVKEDERRTVIDHENHITMIHRTITKVGKLYDVSVVSIPANDATEISARNLGEGVIKEIEQERLATRTRNNNLLNRLKLMEGYQ